MDRQNSLFKDAVFVIICFLIAFTPMARGSVNLWAETLIQIFAVIGIAVLLIEKILLKPEHSKLAKIKEKSFKLNFKPDLYIITLTVIIGIASLFFSNYKTLAAEGLLMLLTYISIYYMASESVNTRKKERTIVYVIISTAIVISIIGLLKRFELNPFPFWDYLDLSQSGYNSITGPYGNRNHMAGFLDMAIPVMMGLFLIRERGIEIRLLMITSAIFLIVIQALTLSRSGWIATISALIFMLVTLLLQKNFHKKGLLITIVVSVVIVGIFVIASTPAINRVVTLIQHDNEDNMESRVSIWTGTVNLIKKNPLSGTGAGTYAEAHPLYDMPGYAHLSVYAHNDYLQFIADTGIFIVPVILAALFFLFKAGFTKLKSKSRQTRGFALGAMAGVLAITIHSFSDFNLHIPANIILFIVLTAIIIRQNA